MVHFLFLHGEWGFLLMVKEIISEPSRTFMEYRFLPGETVKDCTPDNISLRIPLTKFTKERGIESAKIILNVPFLSAAMQSVTGAELAIVLAQNGGIGVHYCSQAIEEQARKVREVKDEKAGFVKPNTLFPDDTVRDAFIRAKDKNHSIYPIADKDGMLLGSININYLKNVDMDTKLSDVMRKFIPETMENICHSIRERKISDKEIIKIIREYIPFAQAGINLKEAYKILEDSNSKFIAIVGRNNKLDSLVFRKDIYRHLSHPNELVDSNQRYMSAAAINTHDYEKRVPALVDAGVDLLVVDSSDGHTQWQKECIQFCKRQYSHIPIMGGNIITAEGFKYLVEAGADAVKVGMGGGSICITQEQKGTGRGQADVVKEVSKARDDYFNDTGTYIPIISDGGHAFAKDMTMALAFGADAVMCGRVFVGCEESNAPFKSEDKKFKQYWGEGHSRAKAWRQERYGQISFDEGVDGFVPFVGKLKENVLDDVTHKMKSTMITCGCCNIQELHENARVQLVSELSIKEGKPHDIILTEPTDYKSKTWG